MLAAQLQFRSRRTLLAFETQRFSLLRILVAKTLGVSNSGLTKQLALSVMIAGASPLIPSVARGGSSRERVLSHLLNSSFAAAPLILPRSVAAREGAHSLVNPSSPPYLYRVGAGGAAGRRARGRPGPLSTVRRAAVWVN